MDQLVLERTVHVEGRDFWGRYASITFSPTNYKSGWVWEVMGVDIPITPDLMANRHRRIALVHKDHALNEFEHIGILRAAGLQHVRIYSPRKAGWLPYCGGSFQIWQAVMPHVRKEGVLAPHRAPTERIEEFSVLPDDKSRWVSYSRDEAKELRMTGVLEFPKIRPGIHRFGHVYPRDDLLPLVRSRTLGWPPALYHVSRLAGALGWPHHKESLNNHILWPQEEMPSATLMEIGRHRLLDALAILNFAAPTGSYLAGTFHSVKGNHRTDLELLKRLAASKVLSFARSA